MPLDAARWQLDIMAADKTAAAFSSVNKRMKGLQADTGALGGVGAASMAKLSAAVGALGAAFGAAALAHKAWAAGMKAADLGEQAEQIGITTDQLQAYRFVGAQAGVQTEQMDTAITKLAKSMGAAAGGSKEMIEKFQQLGVNLLDANGELRPVADVLPEVAKGILNIGSSSQRTATLMELFGRSGAKMTTVLEEFAKGNDAVVASVRKAGGILEKDVIQAWDKTADSLVRAGLAAEVTYAKIGAPIVTNGLAAVESSLQVINRQFTELSNSVALINTHRGALAQIMEVVNVLTFGIGAAVVGKDAFTRATEGIDRARAAAVEAEVELQRLQSTAARTGMGHRYESAIENQRKRVEQTKAEVAAAEAVLDNFNAKNAGTMPPVTVAASRGTANPAAKGDTDAYAKIIADAQQYIAMKKIETEGIGMNAEAAARLKHEQELLGKATSANLALGPQQIAQLKQYAAAMADADAAFGSAKFMDGAATKTKEFIAAQEIERATLFMSTEAAMAYRIEQDLLNKAVNDNIVLTDAQKSKLGEYAAAQAAAAEKTRQTKEMLDLGKDAVKGFMSDMVAGLREGKNVWETFGNAATNVLNKITDKLLQMAIDDVFNAAFGGAKGGGGGIFNFLGGLLGFGGGGMGAAGTTGSPYYGPITPPGFANGGDIPVGVPFRVGERGPETMVLGGNARVYNRQQWGGGDVFVTVHNHANANVETRKSKGPGGQMNLEIIVEAVEAKMSNRVSRGQGSLGRTMEGTYGLQRQGR